MLSASDLDGYQALFNCCSHRPLHHANQQGHHEHQYARHEQLRDIVKRCSKLQTSPSCARTTPYLYYHHGPQQGHTY